MYVIIILAPVVGVTHIRANAFVGAEEYFTGIAVDSDVVNIVAEQRAVLRGEVLDGLGAVRRY